MKTIKKISRKRERQDTKTTKKQSTNKKRVIERETKTKNTIGTVKNVYVNVV